MGYHSSKSDWFAGVACPGRTQNALSSLAGTAPRRGTWALLMHALLPCVQAQFPLTLARVPPSFPPQGALLGTAVPLGKRAKNRRPQTRGCGGCTLILWLCVCIFQCEWPADHLCAHYAARPLETQRPRRPTPRGSNSSTWFVG